MRILLAVLALCFSGAAAMSAEIKSTSRIVEVTVFPAGAEIARLASVKLERGEHVVILSDLPAQAIAASIRIEGKATGRLEIGSVDVRRVSVPHTDAAVAESERRRLEIEIERLRDERNGLAGQIQAAEAQRQLITNLAQLPVRPPPQAGAAPQEDWNAIYGLIGTRLGDVAKIVLDLQVKTRSVDRRIEDLTRKLNEVAPRRHDRTEAKVNLSAGAALEAELMIRYQVPSAGWTPFYEARLATGSKSTPPRLTLTRRASIRQNTDEEWRDVTLALSTTRPASGTAAPQLRPVVVDFVPDLPPPRPMAVPPPVASAPAPQMERSLKKRATAPEASEAMMDVDERKADVQAAPFQATFAVPGKVTVLPTGEIKRVQLDQQQFEPTLTVRTTPVREPVAFLYTKFAVPRGVPMLPGQVLLFRDNTFVGNGSVPLLSPGEEHELGFGRDDLVRVRHAVVESKRGEKGLISSSKTDDRNFRITIKNLHERPMSVTVMDQLPVSRNQEITVEMTSRVQPSRRDVEDRRGVLAWDMRLEPDEERVLEFGYRMTWPAAKQIVVQ